MNANAASNEGPCVLGIMSGTSLDGVDYALCRMESHRAELREFWHVPFPRALRRRLWEAAEGRVSSHELAQLHHDLGRFYARHADRLSPRRHPRLVGLHGQTVFHRPHRSRPATLQLGEPSYLAESLRVPVIHNFRAADLAAGGQGAPLATAFHTAQFARRGEHVCVNNLGGISNVTSIDWVCGDHPHLLAFDTGPANLLLNQAVDHYTGGRRTMDRNGAWAGRGHVHLRLLRTWLRHPFLRQSPPKSTGREMFGADCFSEMLGQIRQFKLSRDDALATLTRFTAESIALNYRRHLRTQPQRVILCGGGAGNGRLVQDIREALGSGGDRASVEVLTSMELGWPWQSVEPAAFAWLAWLRRQGRPGNEPATTGACRPVLLGQITEL